MCKSTWHNKNEEAQKSKADKPGYFSCSFFWNFFHFVIFHKMLSIASIIILCVMLRVPVKFQYDDGTLHSSFPKLFAHSDCAKYYRMLVHKCARLLLYGCFLSVSFKHAFNLIRPADNLLFFVLSWDHSA